MAFCLSANPTLQKFQPPHGLLQEPMNGSSNPRFPSRGAGLHGLRGTDLGRSSATYPPQVQLNSCVAAQQRLLPVHPGFPEENTIDLLDVEFVPGDVVLISSALGNDQSDVVTLFKRAEALHFPND